MDRYHRTLTRYRSEHDGNATDVPSARPVPTLATTTSRSPLSDTGNLSRTTTPETGISMGPVIAPLLSANDELTPAIEHGFFHLAAAAQAGDDAARDILFTAVEEKLDRFVDRTARLAWDANTARRDGLPWEIEDLQQERFPIFVDLLQGWDGQRPFGAYLLAHFPWRLRHARRALTLPRRYEVTPLPPGVALLTDDSFAAEETRLLIESLASTRPPIEQALLLWHLRDGESLAVVARRLGRNRRTVSRRWHSLQDKLRHVLSDRHPTETTAPDDQLIVGRQTAQP